jgi:hypothetical protein
MTRRRKQSEITSFTKTSKDVKHIKKTDKKPTPTKTDLKSNDTTAQKNTNNEETNLSMQSINSMDTEILTNNNTISNSNEHPQDNQPSAKILGVHLN